MITAVQMAGHGPAVTVSGPSGLVFLSDIGPGWGDESPLPHDIAAQCARTADHLEQALATRGLGWHDVAKVLLYLTDMSERGAVQAAFAERFGTDWRPAITIVQVDNLRARGARLNLDVTAAG